MAEIKFEQALVKLEKIVEELESGKLPLEEAITKYETGMKLSRICSQKLEAGKERIEILVKSDKRSNPADKDKVIVKPFCAKEESDSEEGVKKIKRDKVKKENVAEGFLF